MELQLKVATCPNDVLSYTNRAVVNPNDIQSFSNTKYAEVINSQHQHFIFTLEPSDLIQRNYIGFNVLMRKWALLSTNELLIVRPYIPDLKKHSVAKMTVTVEYVQKTNAVDTFNTDEMAAEFLRQFTRQSFTKDQMCVFKFQDKRLLKLVVKEMEAIAVDLEKNIGPKIDFGILLPNSQIVFEKSTESGIKLTGQAKGKIVRQSIINPNWDFESMGIGGLDKEFNAIFRRAFASRVFPPEIIEELGIKHVRGILLFGPPGTGKTLMARQIGKMLNAREPKIVNGPQILDKYVGESEANIRKLFEDAEEEQARMGINSGLHIIIFDEIDAICKARGSVAGTSAVHDTVVNQLLAKIDGVDSLNNILVIGMTNRKDMIDEALLRPGRLEVQMEISLPNEEGRVQILNIHTSKMRQYKKVAPDVDIRELATLTKNFSGAEIEGLVRAAQSTAMNRLVKATSKVELDAQAYEKLLVTRNDFMLALENDIKPAFGTSTETIERLIMDGIIIWNQVISELLDDGHLFTEQVRSPESSHGIVSILIEGNPNSGKTALAGRIALNSNFPFIKLCSPDDMVGFTEPAKCQAIRKVFDDAYKSTLSCILVDNIERLLDYGPIGPRYSNLVLQALMVLLKKEPPPGKKLLVLCTTSCRQLLHDMELLPTFTTVLHCPNLTTADDMLAVLQAFAIDSGNIKSCFSVAEIRQIYEMTKGRRLTIGIKKLIAYIDMAKQMDPSARARKLICKLEDEGAIQLS
ncbi:vesicle-fusing ATPase 1-like [Dermatophagoides pteronyssinus]|uniref:vesicle-fusing ATPase 1-like n=1 Tax=Dermatophagoides pteronyssinus TaxID=6956 RepID=UPI003F678F1D